MKPRFSIIAFGAIIFALCIYYLSFSLISKGVKDDATAYATNAEGIVDQVIKQEYLDSMSGKTVLDLGFKTYTYKDIQKEELQLGLDLQGGMHVTLEVSPVDLIKALAGRSANDPAFQTAIANASKALQNSDENFLTLFVEAYKQQNTGKALNQLFTSKSLQGIDFKSTDQEVISAINKETRGSN